MWKKTMKKRSLSDTDIKKEIDSNELEEQDIFWSPSTIHAILENSPIRPISPIVKDTSEKLKKPHYEDIIKSVVEPASRVLLNEKSVLDECMEYVLLKDDRGRTAIYKAIWPHDDEYNKVVKYFEKGPLYPPGTEPKLKLVDIHFKF